MKKKPKKGAGANLIYGPTTTSVSTEEVVEASTRILTNALKGKFKEPMDNDSKRFLQGLACGASFVARDCDMPTMAKEIIEKHGYGLQDLIDAEVDNGDIESIYGRAKARQK